MLRSREVRSIGARSFTTWLSTLAIAGGMALGASSPYEGQPVVKIDFRPLEQPLGAAYLTEILPIRPGVPLRVDDVRAAIERLYATGRYEDIVAEAVPAPGGVNLRFTTRPQYFIGRVAVQGVPEPPNKGVLVNATGLELGAPFQEGDVRQATTELGHLLRTNGFYESRIEPRFQHDPATGQVTVNFAVRSGPRARYAPPKVEGVPAKDVPTVARAAGWRGWFGWKRVTENHTQEGLERIRKTYRKEDHLMSEVTLTAADYERATERVTARLAVRPGPRVRIRTVGAKVSSGKLKRMVPIFQEQAVDRDLLMEGARNLREYFQASGYFDAQVDFQATKAAPDEELVEYRIERGERHKLAAVFLAGNRYFSSDTLRERMYVRPSSWPQSRRGRYSEELLRRDLAAITALYTSNGFRDAAVSRKLEHPYRGKAGELAVRILIQEGAQWRVAALELSGLSPDRREAVQSLLQESAGQPFSESNVSVDRDNILEYYYNQGYPQATFEWSFQPTAEPQRVTVSYVIREGPRRHLREVLVSGLERTNPKLVTERVWLQPGAALSRTEVLETQSRLHNLGIFAKVDVALQNPAGEERDKYVLVNIDESSRYTLTGGVGAEIAKIGGCRDCFEAPAGKAGFSPRVYFDVTRRNAFGVGHIVSLKTRASTLQKRGILSYEAPQFHGSADLSLLFSGMYEDSRDVRTFSARRQEGSVQLGQKISRASQMLYRYTYRRVSVDPNTLQISSPLLIPLFSQPVRLGIVAANFIQDRRDDPTNSHRGIYNTLDAGWASKAFGSQVEKVLPAEAETALVSEADFTRFLGHNATYHSWGMGNRYVLARSLTFGWLQRVNPQREIPLPERFFAGGAASHRGFPENQAGPRDERTGFPVGGRALLLNQVEVRFPVWGENLGGVLFEDAGNVYSGLGKLGFRVQQRDVKDFDYMVHAVGFGIRYRTPVGPLRIDLAWALNPPNFIGFKGTREQLLFGGGLRTHQQISHFQFHFSLGQAF